MMDVVTKKPKGREDLSLQELGDETILYDPKNEKVHVLNRTAFFIWVRCDGNHSIAEIKAEMERTFQPSADVDFLEDIKLALDDFEKKELLL